MKFNKRKSLIIKIIALSSTFSLLLIGVNAHAETKCFATERVALINSQIKRLSDSYGDVPSSVDCESVDNHKVEKLICSKAILSLMELLDSKAFVYAYENATGQEVDHKKPLNSNWIKATRNQAKDENDLCNIYMEHTTDSLGHVSSPYLKKEKDSETEG
jgi:hypothetical protein